MLVQTFAKTKLPLKCELLKICQSGKNLAKSCHTAFSFFGKNEKLPPLLDYLICTCQWQSWFYGLFDFSELISFALFGPSYLKSRKNFFQHWDWDSNPR